MTYLIRNKKTPRLGRSLLQRPKSLRGLDLTNFISYCWASNIRVMEQWCQFETSILRPAWLDLELSLAKPALLTALIHSPLYLPLSPYWKNVPVKSTIRILKQFRHHFGLQNLPLLAPIKGNSVFHPSLIHAAFLSWSAQGIVPLHPSNSSQRSILSHGNSFSDIYRVVA